MSYSKGHLYLTYQLSKRGMPFEITEGIIMRIGSLPPEGYYATIKDLNGKISYYGTTPLNSISRLIQTILGYWDHNCRLIYKGNALNPKGSLSNYDYKIGDPIYLIQRIGPPPTKYAPFVKE